MPGENPNLPRMPSAVRELLLGFLLELLEPDERREVERILGENEHWQGYLEQLRPLLNPLHFDDSRFDPPSDLVHRTSALVTSIAVTPADTDGSWTDSYWEVGAECAPTEESDPNLPAWWDFVAGSIEEGDVPSDAEVVFRASTDDVRVDVSALTAAGLPPPSPSSVSQVSAPQLPNVPSPPPSGIGKVAPPAGSGSPAAVNPNTGKASAPPTAGGKVGPPPASGIGKIASKAAPNEAAAPPKPAPLPIRRPPGSTR